MHNTYLGVGKEGVMSIRIDRMNATAGKVRVVINPDNKEEAFDLAVLAERMKICGILVITEIHVSRDKLNGPVEKFELHMIPIDRCNTGYLEINDPKRVVQEHHETDNDSK